MVYSNIKCSTIKKCYSQLIHCKVNPHETCRGNNPVNKFFTFAISKAHLGTVIFYSDALHRTDKIFRSIFSF